MAANKFPAQYEKFKDTRGSGTITIDGIELDVDSKGFIEAPVRYEDVLASHGFLRLNGPAYVAWERAKAATKG